MLFPKKAKHRKWQRMRKSPERLMKPETRGIDVSFGSHGLQATAPAQVTSNQIEAARKATSRALGKTGRMWIRIFPDRPVTAKPAEVRMGKGKGDPKGYVFEVRPGRIIFEVDGVDDATAREALRKASTKFPMKCKVIERV